MPREICRKAALAEGGARLPLSAVILLALCGGCPGDIPGEVVGTYRVELDLEENTCGNGAAPFPDGKSYSVELRAEGPRGYWHIADAPPYPGQHDAGQFDFAFAQALELGSADAGTGGCIVLREETLRAHLDDAPGDAGADDTRLRGEHVIGFRADPQGRCRDERGPLREFERLPCRARYRIDGKPRSAF